MVRVVLRRSGLFSFVNIYRETHVDPRINIEAVFTFFDMLIYIRMSK